MKILVTAPQGKTFELHFPEHILEQLRAMGEVELNPFSRPFTREELKARLADAEIVLTHWGTPQIDAELLACTEHTILQPHASCCSAKWRMTQAIIDDLGRFLRGEPLKLQVSLRQYRLMTQE